MRRYVPSFHLENGNSFFLMIHFLMSTYGEEESNVYCSTQTFSSGGSFADLSHHPTGGRISNSQQRKAAYRYVPISNNDQSREERSDSSTTTREKYRIDIVDS